MDVDVRDEAARRFKAWCATHEGLVLILLLIFLGGVIGWEYQVSGGERALWMVIFGVAVAISAQIVLWAGQNVSRLTAWLRSL